MTSGSVDTGLVPPQSPGYGGCHRGLCPTPEVGGGVVLGVVGGQKGKERWQVTFHWPALAGTSTSPLSPSTLPST